MLASMLYVHFNVTVGFNPTALYIYDKERCPMLGLHDKPTKFNAGYNACFNALCTKKNINTDIKSSMWFNPTSLYIYDNSVL